MTATMSRPFDSARVIPITLIAVSLLGGIFLGISPVLAAFAILACAILFVLDVATTGQMNRGAMWCVLFLAMCAISGVAFGGFASLKETSIIGWLANEGRVFLYYWPALFIMQCFPAARTETPLRRVFRITTIAISLAMAGKVFAGFSTFSTHHAAGAFCAVLIIYNAFQYERNRTPTNLLFLLLSLMAMFATNSRTSLLAVLIAILMVYLSASKIIQILKISALLFPLILTMPIFFPTQFGRLADAANVETFTSLSQNFALAYRADSPIEVAKAFDLSRGINISGNANLVIRGYLWGRSVGEGLRSPILGSGFGRVNDIGRTYVGVPYLIYPATEAALSSPSNLTAHNGYLQIFAELGLLGSFFLFMLYRVLWVGLVGNPMWAQIGRASIICLLLMSMTQHAFGAPIFGLSLMLTAAIAYRICRNDARRLVTSKP